MEEYMKEAKEASMEPEVVESYDKELHLERLKNSEYEEGVTRAKQEGIKEGIKERNIEIAKVMLKDGVDIKIVSKYTSLSEEEIEKLR